ncbi:MAG: DUF3842 family protein [Thermodesulfobacteriota bacterium]|nr:DUF3842 family protein [Thermodesulfobacteriota bacterium]
MILMVVDGQGGGIGATIIKQVRDTIGLEPEVLAFGTNSIATSRMLKAGANKGATGENAIIRSIPEADMIIGPLAVIMANSMMGELTPGMAEAISSSKAMKILIPLTQENIRVIGVIDEPLPHLVDQAVTVIRRIHTDREPF